jgi:predicted amidohydrolase YtcJ
MSALHADVILVNGRIWTGDSSRPFVEAVALFGERIIAVGLEGDVLALRGPRTKAVDLQGGMAMPGFIDNHTHFIVGGLQLASIDLKGVRSLEGFGDRLAAFASKVPAGEWITGGGWDHEGWERARLPDRRLLDPVTPDHPLLLTRVDFHLAVANSVALRLAGIDRSTLSPEGGEIDRDSNGEPTGILRDTAISLVSRLIPPPTRATRRVALERALGEAARFGVTSLCDMSWIDSAFEDIHVYQQAAREGNLTARVDLYVPIDHWRRLAEAGVERDLGSSFFRIGGLKGFSDGALGSATAWMKKPFADRDGTGLPMPSMLDGTMLENVRGAAEAGLHVALHAIGDQAAEEVLNIFETVPDIAAKRFRIEHAQHLDPALIDRFARLGVVAAMQPFHVADDGRWAARRIGEERCRWMAPFRSLVDAGAVVTFGSDWTVAPLDPLVGLTAAVTRQTSDGKNPNGWIPEERLTLEQALRCYTVNNAWAMSREHEVGTLRPGMLADIVTLSHDLFALDPSQWDEVRVRATIVNGRIVYRG